MRNCDWEQRKLGELSEIVRGASPRPIQDPKWFDTNSDVGWLRISDVTEQNGRIYFLEQKISKAGQEKTRVLSSPHLLLSIAATVGKPVVNYVKTGVHDGFLIFLNPIFEREYMFQWLEMFRPKWMKYGQPGSQVNLNSELVRNQDILLPSKEEQTEIGLFFKHFDDTIALHQRKVTLLKRLKEAYLTRMLPQNSENIPLLRFADYFDPWEQRKFEDLAESFNYGLNASAMEFDGENKYIRITDIDEYSHRFIQSGLTSPNTDLSNANDYLLKEGDILFARTGASVGKSYQYEPLDGKVYYAGFLIRARIKPDFDSSFIFQNTLTEKYNNFIKITSQRSGQPGVNAQEYANFSIMVPSRGEQVKLWNFFKQLDNAIALHQCKIEKLAKAKKVLLAAMFV